MNQCLRCNRPCSDTGVFCDACRALIQYSQDRSPRSSKYIADLTTTPLPATVSGDALDCLTVATPFEASPAAESVDHPTLDTELTQDTVKQTVHRLNDAARQVVSGDGEQRRRPRASRLSPLLDISEDVRRDSTPMLRPGSPTRRNDSWSTKLMDEWGEDDVDEDEGDHDIWGEGTDPLMSRPFPSPAETQRIEQEDIERVTSNISGPAVVAKPAMHTRQTSKLRLVTICVIILAVIFLIVDSLLLTYNSLQSHSPVPTSGPPTLILSATEMSYGRSVILQILHFSPQAHVLLTRDVGEQIKTSTGSTYIGMDRSGSARVSISIDSDWSPGFHTIGAVDTITHYTASVSLRVIAGPTRPSQLTVSATKLDFGAGLQGANTIQSLTLRNAGSGNITWSASSDQPWLLLTPSQGIFSKSQTLAMGVQRSNLKPDTYKGQITFSSNVGDPQTVSVEMSVQPLPASAGATLSVSPVVLSFSAVDGGADPDAQVLTLNNAGGETLYWSLSLNPILYQTTTQDSLQSAASWLTTDVKTGVILPGGVATVRVMVHGASLLPGAYINTLVFTASNGHSALNSPQNVAISLTLQPHCGISLSNGSLSFTAVAGQDNPPNQALTLWATASCSSSLGWHASSSANWLTLTPASGQLRGMASASVALGANTSGLKPGPYSATLSILTAMMTQVVTVQLTVQAPSTPSAPLMAASPLNLNFSTTIGQQEPPSQIVTITNTGGSPLNWHTAVNAMGGSLWLGALPESGTIKSGGTAQLTVNVSSANLSPGNYSGQIVLSGTDANNAAAGGSPQNIAVNFSVFAPCVLAHPSMTTIAFNDIQGDANPNPQEIFVTASGNCSWPLTWKANRPLAATWLRLTAGMGALAASGQSSVLKVAVDTAGLAPGSHTAQIKIVVTDSTGVTVGPGILLPVTLTVTGVTITGNVNACDVAGCATPLALPGATVTLINGSTKVASAVADASGNFTFINVPLGTYMLSASGTDSANTHYTASFSITVAHNQQVFPITLLPG